MKQKTKLLLLAAFFALAIPLVITGNASAVYLSDGAVQNSSGGWDLPNHGTCLGGTLSAPATVPNVNVSQCFSQTDATVAAASQTACTGAGFLWNTKSTPAACSNKWTWTYTYSGNDQCLRCHNTGYMVATHSAPQAAKESYLKTGHKNMLRKVQPAGVADPADLATTDPGARYIAGLPWAGPDSTGNLAVYSGDGTNTYNFADGSIMVSGVKQNLYWIYGDWIAAAPSSFYGKDGYNQTRTTFGTNNGYTCANCHSSGFQDALSSTVVGIQNLTTYPTVSYTAAEPQASFPGLAAIGGTGVNAKFDLYGIQCSRCHYSTYPAVGNLSTCKSITNQTFCTANGGTWNGTTCSTISGLDSTTCTTNGGTYTAGNPYSAAAYSAFGPQIRATGTHNNSANSLTAGQDITNICFGCHQSTSGITDSNPAEIPTGVSHGAAYGRDFNGHVLGNSFLNSPHAQFTGTFITNPLNEKDIYGNAASQYASVFSGKECATGVVCNWEEGDAPETKGSCTTCHDVHQSLVMANNEPIRRECEDCHTGNQAGDGSGQAPLVDVNAIAHPTSAGTPFDTTKYDSPCVVCHMATQAEANGDQNSMPAHVWRINTDASYNTFPTMAQFYGGSCSVHSGTLSTNNNFVKVYASDASSSNCTTAGGTWTATTQNKLATMTADGDYAKAVWVDLDMACGQCHGGSGGSAAIHNNAPYMSKADLAGYAASMHNGVSTGTIVPPTPSISGGVIGVDATWTATATDTSTAGSSALQSVTMAWGDGVVTTQAAGTSFSHTYLKAGSYTATQTATDTDGGSASVTYAVTVAAPSIMGHVYKSDGVTAVSGAYVWVTRTANGKTNTLLTGTTSTGSFSFSNLPAGSYTQLKATKSGYTFPAPTNTINTTGGNNVIDAVTP